MNDLFSIRTAKQVDAIELKDFLMCHSPLIFSPKKGKPTQCLMT